MMSVTSSLTRDGGELVQHTVDANAGDRCAGNRRKQRAPKRIAKGVTESGLQRLDDELGPVVGLISSASVGR